MKYYKMKKIKKHNLVVGLLFAYTTGMYIYFVPRNNELDTVENWCIVGVSYLLLVILWFVMRKRDRMRGKYNEELNSPKKRP